MIAEDTRFLIVGLGLIGGSYARGLSKKGFWVDAIDTDPDSIAYALENGLIRRGSTWADPALARGADIVVFALYPGVMIEWVRQNQGLFRPGALLTDVSGVKCHPMAGKEVYGVRNSDEGIFKIANFIVTPTEKNTSGAVETAREIGRLLEFHTITELAPAAHDEIVGFVSQLTHAIAVSLMTCNDDEDLQNYTGDSFRDLTRIARINEKMWSELFLLNRQELISQIDSFTAELLRRRGMLERQDRALFDR